MSHPAKKQKASETRIAIQRISLEQLTQKIVTNELSIDKNTAFPFKAPAHFTNQIDLKNPNDPLLKQILPAIEENAVVEGFDADPVADLENNPIPSLIHKYHGRVLLIASPKCDIHCRYCFRRHFPYSEQSNQRYWQQALDYIDNDQSINEVILSGGDPMALNEQSLLDLIVKVEQIEHIKTLRIHSRTPVVTPDTAPQKDLISWALTSRLNKVLVVHCNHANELSEATQRLFNDYKKAGFTLLNQSVLLKGVNDDLQVLKELSHALFNQGVLPYYLNQLDKVQGSAHFEVSDNNAIELHKKLSAELPGYLVPKLVKDIPNQKSKTQL